MNASSHWKKVVMDDPIFVFQNVFTLQRRFLAYSDEKWKGMEWSHPWPQCFETCCRHSVKVGEIFFGIRWLEGEREEGIHLCVMWSCLSFYCSNKSDLKQHFTTSPIYCLIPESRSGDSERNRLFWITYNDQDCGISVKVIVLNI